MRALYYSKAGKVEHKIAGIKRSTKKIWIDLETPSSDELDYICREFNIHELVKSDYELPSKAPKYVRYNGHAFFIAHVPNPSEGHKLTRKVCFYFGNGFLITIHRAKLPVMDAVFDRVYKNPSHAFGKGIDFLCCLILHSLCENYLTVVEEMEVDVRLKQRVSHYGRMASLQERIIEPLTMSALVQEENQPYFRTLIDYMVRIGSHIALLKEEIQDHIDEQRAEQDAELNRIMKIMTIISTIFLPLNLVAGIYGMNIPYIPGMSFDPMFWLLMCSMLVMALGLLGIFRWQGWL